MGEPSKGPDPSAGSPPSRPAPSGGAMVLHELARGTGIRREPDRFTPEELRGVLGAFRIGNATSARPLQRGDPRAPKVVVQTDRARYVLKRRAPGRDDPEQVALSHALMIELRASGLPVPALIGTRRDNNSMLQTHQHVYEMMAFIEGAPFDGSAGQCESGGEVLADLHAALAHRDPPFPVRTHSYHNAAHVRRSLGRAGTRIGGSVAPLLNHYERAASRVAHHELTGASTQLIHNDWHPGNLLFRGERVAGIVDLESAVRAHPMLDVATGMMQFALRTTSTADSGTWRLELDDRSALAFWRGYARRRTSGDAGPHGPPPPWTHELPGALPALMAESLIAEVASALAETGRLGPIPGTHAAGEIARLLTTLTDRADTGWRLADEMGPAP